MCLNVVFAIYSLLKRYLQRYLVDVSEFRKSIAFIFAFAEHVLEEG